VIRTLIVDDQSMIRVGIRAILESQDDITVVGEAENGRLGVEHCRRLRPDVVLMDVRMPVLDGLAATRAVLGPERAEGHTPRVLMLTTFDLDEYVIDAFRAGASGFLLKTAPRDQLVAAVRTVHAGEALLAPLSTRKLIEQFAQPAGESAALASLTARERDVLVLLSRGLSNPEIAAELVVESSTVKSHVASVLSKLGLRDRVQAVVFAYESGVVRPGASTVRDS